MTKFDAYYNGKKLVKGDILKTGLTFDHVTEDNKIAVVGGGFKYDPMDMSIELKRFAGTIDLTPTWRAIVPILLMGLENGNAEGRKAAIEEIYRMADIADAYGASKKG